MITDLTLSPMVLIIGQWEHPVDLYKSSNKRILKDRMRYVKIEEKSKETVYTLSIKKRFSEEQYIKVRKNLWRIKEGYSDWTEPLVLTLSEGFSKFVLTGIEFIGELQIINKVQVRIGVYYNESRNVSAAAFGYSLY